MKKTIQKLQRLFNWICKHGKPKLFMNKEQLFPTVKSGRKNLVFGAKRNQCSGSFEIFLEHIQDKGERIGTIWDKNIRQNSMGMPAGRADNPWYWNLRGKQRTFVHTNQISSVRSMVGQTAFCEADRTNGGRRTKKLKNQKKVCYLKYFLN